MPVIRGPNTMEIADRPTLPQQDLDHLMTDHGTFGLDTTLQGNNRRKSKFFDHVNIKDLVAHTFNVFANDIGPGRSVDVQANGYIIYEWNCGQNVGKGLDGPTSLIWLVMEVRPSGSTRIVTAYPVN